MTWWELKSDRIENQLKAIIYMRHSADIGQENSVEIQRENILAFASKHGIEVIAEFADCAKSGLNAEGRPQFLEMIEFIKADKGTFSLVIAYDVSRWGRFQDTDLSAHYESICRQHGKEVIFAAHGSYGDQENTLINQLRKNIDRYQAAEYSKVLSKKTKDGAIKVATQGYRPGGSPPYGMRRVMLNEQKKRDRILEPGQRKGLQNGRTILEPGDMRQVAVVKEIFQLFVEREYSEQQISGHLNNKEIPSPGGVRWTASSVRNILLDEQYAGSVVYNKTSSPLKTKNHHNPPEEWIITPESYEPIISRDLFERSKAQFLARKRCFSAKEIQKVLTNVFEKYGLLTASLLRVEEAGLTERRVREHFGSIPEAFQTLFPEVIESVKNTIFQEIANETRNVFTYESFLVVDELFTVRIEPAMPLPYGYGFQWFFRQDLRSTVDVTLGVPLSGGDKPEILGYFPLPRIMAREEIFHLTDLASSKIALHGYSGIDFIRELIHYRNNNM